MEMAHEPPLGRIESGDDCGPVSGDREVQFWASFLNEFAEMRLCSAHPAPQVELALG